MKNVEKLTQFFKFQGSEKSDVLLLFFIDDKYYLYDPIDNIVQIDYYTPSSDKSIGEYNIEIAKFIVGLYDKDL